jgi:hypothetical protein
MASDIIPRHFRSVTPMREMTIVEEVLLRRHSLGTSQRGSVARWREGYVVSISVLMSGSLALVGMLWIRNLVQCPLIWGSTSWRALISAESIGR